MKRLSRHTVVVLLVALMSSVGGLTLAVVAFGQGDGSTVPTSPYTTTTPPTGTTPLSPYTTTPTTTPTKTSTTEATTTNGANPERDHGRTVPKDNGGPVPSGPVPSKETRKGPSHLAFTGAEPIYLGLLGAALMAGGLMLHRRRRAATDR